MIDNMQNYFEQFTGDETNKEFWAILFTYDGHMLCHKKYTIEDHVTRDLPILQRDYPMFKFRVMHIGKEGYGADAIKAIKEEHLRIWYDA